jgi:hypothetical protein
MHDQTKYPTCHKTIGPSRSHHHRIWRTSRTAHAPHHHRRGGQHHGYIQGMYVNMYVCACVCVFRVHVSMCVGACGRVCNCVCVCVCACVCAHAYACWCAFVNTWVCVCETVCLCLCVRVYLCFYMNFCTCARADAFTSTLTCTAHGLTHVHHGHHSCLVATYISSTDVVNKQCAREAA